MRNFYKVGVFFLVLLGIFSTFYIVSTIENFVKSNRTATREEASKIRVEVLNGSSVSGLAERVAEKLRDRGFDVLEFGTAKEKVPATVILDRSDVNLGNAKFVSRIFKQGKITFEPHPFQLVDVTVVLGEDFKEQKEKNK
jgi:hypothetical protein